MTNSMVSLWFGWGFGFFCLFLGLWVSGFCWGFLFGFGVVFVGVFWLGFVCLYVFVLYTLKKTMSYHPPNILNMTS